MFLSGQCVQTKRLPDLDRGQDRFFVAQSGTGVVATLHIGPQESRLVPDRAGGLENQFAIVLHFTAHPQGHATPNGIAHLTGKRTLPNQLIQSGFIAAQLALDQFRKGRRVASGTDCLVSLLRVLNLALVRAGLVRQKLRAEGLGDARPGLFDGQVAQGHRVGTHVSDEAVLVQLLSGAHGALGVKAKLAAALLLQGRGDKGRGGFTRHRLFVSGLDLEVRRSQLAL